MLLNSLQVAHASSPATRVDASSNSEVRFA
jgi:hypothetical protein